jgi:hypothetical protein
LLQRPIMRRLDPWDVPRPRECRTDARGPRPTTRCHRDHDDPASRPRENDPQLVHPPRSRRMDPCCFRCNPPGRPRLPAPGSGNAVGVARPTRLHKRSTRCDLGLKRKRTDRSSAQLSRPRRHRPARSHVRPMASIPVRSLALREAFPRGTAGASALTSSVMHPTVAGGVVSSCHLRRRW